MDKEQRLASVLKNSAGARKFIAETASKRIGAEGLTQREEILDRRDEGSKTLEELEARRAQELAMRLAPRRGERKLTR